MGLYAHPKRGNTRLIPTEFLLLRGAQREARGSLPGKVRKRLNLGAARLRREPG